TFIGAPVGYGKSVLVSAIEKTKSVIRFDLNSENASDFPAEFFDVVGDIENWKKSETQGSIWVVVENIHELNDENMLDTIYKMACESGSVFRFVLTSRINYYSFRSPEVLSGNINLVTADMFLLNRLEIIAYLGVCGIKIDDEIADQIYNRTGGCINIIFHVLKRYVTTRKLTFSEEVVNYLYQTQLAYLTADEETVGNRLAVLGRFTVQLAKAVRERVFQQEFLEQGPLPITDKILERLCRKNYFISYDLETREYRFNEFFINHIMNIYRDNYPEELEVMQEIVAEVHAEAGDYARAAYFYYLCDDHHSMLRAVEKENRIVVENDNREAYISYYRDSSRQVRSKYHLAVLYLAWRFFNYGEIQLCKKASAEFLEDLYADKEISEEQRKSLLCDYYLFSGMTGFYDLDRVIHKYESALEVFDGNPRTYHTLVPRTFGSTSILRLIYNGGSMEELVKKIYYIADMGNKLIGDRWKGYDAATAAEAHFLRMEVDMSKILMEKAMHECVIYDRLYGGTMAAMLFLRAQVALIEGDAAYLRKNIFDTDMPEEIIHNSTSRATVEACFAWIYAQLGMTEKIAPWIKSGNFAGINLMYPAMPSVYLIHIYVLLTLGKYTKVLSYGDYFFKEGPASENLLIRQEACMIFGAAASELGKVTIARQCFEAALELAHQTGNVTSIILYGDRLLHFFSDVPEKYKKMAVSLRAKVRSFIAARKRVSMQLDIVRFMGLTEKEMQVAKCVERGRTNKDIAKELSISENTVKSTLKRIFSKLNITSRRQLSELIRQYEQ
ncbi:MAG: hypothetical protein IKV96_04255, partial [Firmicutes bacterium]|nr:hypothetical protein [Bacillota bacterium]